jgi:deoxyhypusine monooxygenase
MTAPPLQRLAAVLQDQSGAESLDSRFRALFALKGWTISDSTTSAGVVDIIDKAFEKNDSALLKHELAYVLGQIKDKRAIPCLIRVLSDKEEHPMVRHEAAEAMGAISCVEAIPVLEKFLSDANISVRETCELALQKIKYDLADSADAIHQKVEEESEAMALARAKAAMEGRFPKDESLEGVFLPIDPAPAHTVQSDILLNSIPKYRAQLTAGDALPLFERYRAMFSLRNAVHAARQRLQRPSVHPDIQSAASKQAESAIQALAAGLVDKSALFRHEICFVFGELAHPASAPSMLQVLNDEKEEDMVRHEAAEALGAVVEEGGMQEEDQTDMQTQSILRTLLRWSQDEKAPRVVRESCIVALDEMAYNKDPTQFQPMEV